MTTKYQILRRNMSEIADSVITDYANRRYFERKNGSEDQTSRLSALNQAVYDSLDDWCENPHDPVEYTANVRFLTLIYAYRNLREALDAHRYVSGDRLEFLGEVIAEFLLIKERYERSNDKTSEEFRNPIKDNNGEELDDKLVGIAVESLVSANWKAFDDWRKNNIYSLAVVTLSE